MPSSRPPSRASIGAWSGRPRALDPGLRGGVARPGTDAAAALFAEDATYLMHPFAQPVAGLDAIRAPVGRRARGGRGVHDGVGVVAVEGDTGVARIEVRYRAPRGGQVPRPLDRAARPRRPLPALRGVAVRRRAAQSAEGVPAGRPSSAEMGWSAATTFAMCSSSSRPSSSAPA